jgi:hypothetical protein
MVSKKLTGAASLATTALIACSDFESQGGDEETNSPLSISNYNTQRIYVLVPRTRRKFDKDI